MHTGAISKLLYGLRVCTGNNPHAEACGLYFYTDSVARTEHTLTYTCNVFIWIKIEAKIHELLYCSLSIKKK